MLEKLEKLPPIVLFDWDGTLVDSHAAIFLAVNDLLTEMGHNTISYEEYKGWGSRSVRDHFPELFGADADRADQFFYAAYGRRASQLEPLPGAEALLTFLHARGVEMAVVSNKRGPALRAEVDRLGWRHFFKGIVGSGDATRDKPDPAHGELALMYCTQVLEDSSHAWFVGDMDVDLALADALNMTCVLVGENAPHLKGQSVKEKKIAIHSFLSCQELLNYIASPSSRGHEKSGP